MGGIRVKCDLTKLFEAIHGLLLHHLARHSIRLSRLSNCLKIGSNLKLRPIHLQHSLLPFLTVIAPSGR